MPKINVYLSDDLATAVRDAQLPVSAICQAALEQAVRDVTSIRGSDEAPLSDTPAIGLFRRFTPRARHALTLAEQAAAGVPHNYVETEHVLLGIIDEGSNLALKVIASLNIEVDDLRRELIGSRGPATKAAKGHVPFGPLAKRALEATTKEALTLGHNYIGCEHMLLGLLATDEGLASQVLRRLGLELRTTRRAVVTALSGLIHARVDQAAAPRSAGAEVPAAILAEILQRLDAIEGRLAR